MLPVEVTVILVLNKPFLTFTLSISFMSIHFILPVNLPLIEDTVPYIVRIQQIVWIMPKQ
ncbi:hypothetical protein MKX66_03840 [Bacillus sp. FSL R9-9530]|uniref:hypothetical protein n=1 Tax=Bacillus cereus group sp. MG9 TaxID=3040247 RepID=UPI000DE5ACBC|nr:hypothetical protein [Bacillus mycoides]